MDLNTSPALLNCCTLVRFWRSCVKVDRGPKLDGLLIVHWMTQKDRPLSSMTTIPKGVSLLMQMAFRFASGRTVHFEDHLPLDVQFRPDSTDPDSCPNSCQTPTRTVRIDLEFYFAIKLAQFEQKFSSTYLFRIRIFALDIVAINFVTDPNSQNSLNFC